MNPIERALADADKIQAANRRLEELSRPGAQCGLDCTVDCGHCKGAGTPLQDMRNYAAFYLEGDGTWHQFGIVSGREAKGMRRRSPTPDRVKFQELP